MRAWFSLRMAYRHFRFTFGRMTLSIVAVALGVGLVVAVRLMNAAALDSFVQTLDDMAGRAALSVTAGDGLTFAEDVVEKLSAIPEIEVAVPLVTSVAFPDDSSGELLTVYGVDLTHDADVRLYHKGDGSGEVIDDLVVFLSQPDSIVLGREFARSRGLNPGKTVDLATPQGVKRFTIRGLLDAEGIARTLGGRIVVMDLYAAERAFTRDGQISQIDIVVRPGADPERVKVAVASVLPPGLKVEEPALRKDVIRRTIGGFQAMVSAFGLLAVIAGFVICYGRLGAIFEARTWEIGLLRAAGLRRLVVFAELLKESLLLGAAGAVVGIPLGVLIAEVGLPLLARTTALTFNLPAPSTQLGPHASAFLVGAGVGLMAAVAAAAIPAARAARSSPVAAITMRGREIPSPPPTGRWAFRVLPLAIVCLVALQQLLNLPALGHATTAIIVLSACAFARPLVRIAQGFLAPASARIFGPPGRFAAGHLERQARRTTLTVATLGVGLGTVLLFGLLGWSFERSLVSTMTARYSADLVITSAFVSGGYRNAPMSEDVLAKLRDFPEVSIVAGEEQRDTMYAGTSMVIASFDPSCFADRRVCNWPLDPGSHVDALRLVARGDAVMVSRSFAHRHGARPGDTITLESPKGPQSFAIVGVTAGQPQSAVVMSRELYRNTWGDPFVAWIHVRLADGVDRDRVRERIARGLGRDYRLRVFSSAEMIDHFAGQVRQAFSLQYVAEVITFFLVLIGIGDTLAAGVVARTREFGMIRAVGAHRSRLFEVVMLEGTMIGVLGLVLAAGLGLALGIFWIRVQLPAILGWNLDLYFPSRFAFMSAVLALLVCLVGSIVPSVHAARISIPAALRNE